MLPANILAGKKEGKSPRIPRFRSTFPAVSMPQFSKASGADDTGDLSEHQNGVNGTG